MKLVSKKNGTTTIFPNFISAVARKIGFTPPSGMSSTNVQDAIEEVNGKIPFNANNAFSSCSDCYIAKGAISGIVYNTASDYPSAIISSESFAFIYYYSCWEHYGIQLAVSPSGITALRALSNGTWSSWRALS